MIDTFLFARFSLRNDIRRKEDAETTETERKEGGGEEDALSGFVLAETGWARPTDWCKNASRKEACFKRIWPLL